MAVKDIVAISSQPGPVVTLYDLDLTPIGVNSILHFTNSAGDDQVGTVFQGIQYVAVEVVSSGWSATGTGPFPQPDIQVSNVNDLFSGLVRQYQDLIGAKLSRKRLFRSFLDDGVYAGQGANALFALDTYYLYQKTSHNKMLVEWKLASSVDQQGQQLPARLVIRDSCQFQYRRWDDTLGAFNYTNVDCPYTGGAYYDTTDAPTAPQLDACSKKTTGCKLRFAGTGFLPFGGFPGVGVGDI